MARLAPLERNQVPELEELFGLVEQVMGFVPNSMLTMARRPEIVRGAGALARAIRFGTVDTGLKELIALVASTAAGCRYCQAHTASNAVRLGAVAAKVAHVWDYEASDLFTDAERSALRLAHHAGLVPNQATDADFVELRRHFDAGEIVEIVAMISLFGFLNRWNDTIVTQLEDEPFAVASEVLGGAGWEPGDHAAATAGSTLIPSTAAPPPPAVDG